MTYQSRIPELIESLEKTRDPSRLRPIMLDLGTGIGRHVLDRIRKNQPVGEVEPSYQIKGRRISHGRPSWRLFGTGSDIGSSWLEPEVEIEARKREGQIVIASTAPHIEVVMDGSKKPGWNIPNSPTGVSFYHINPSRRSPGGYFHGQIRHPGLKGNDFVDRSMEEAKPGNFEELRHAVNRVVAPVRGFFK